jgi:hypothetical protein
LPLATSKRRWAPVAAGPPSNGRLPGPPERPRNHRRLSSHFFIASKLRARLTGHDAGQRRECRSRIQGPRFLVGLHARLGQPSHESGLHHGSTPRSGHDPSRVNWPGTRATPSQWALSHAASFSRETFSGQPFGQLLLRDGHFPPSPSGRRFHEGHKVQSSGVHHAESLSGQRPASARCGCGGCSGAFGLRGTGPRPCSFRMR